METTVYVGVDSHNRGVASALYSKLIQTAKYEGIYFPVKVFSRYCTFLCIRCLIFVTGMHCLIACIGGVNPGSEALHRKFKFKHIGRLTEVGFKFDQWQDSNYYQLML